MFKFSIKKLNINNNESGCSFVQALVLFDFCRLKLE